jgi:tRNA U34 2-thiouridine synthase MnmA/TrmU
MSEKRKAAVLVSGGLDSMLAARLIMDQGVHVEGLNFYTGFCVEGHTHAIRKQDRKREKRNNALWVAEQLGIKLHIVDVCEEYKDVLTNPRHGYGANINPCLDCKSFMVRKAHEWITEKGFDFIVTGEVVGQRPMSQRRATMPIIARESGAGDLLLRPLSAKVLPETVPEREGWVDREQLFDITGRSRKAQMAMAKSMGIDDYAQPAGGCCFLTDAAYANKLQDLWRARGSKNYDMEDILLLKVGRHIRPRPHFKLIIAREEGEVNFLQGYRKQYPTLTTVSHNGPLALLDGEVSAADLQLAASIVARYSQGRTADEVEVGFADSAGGEHRLKVAPMSPGEIDAEWIL